MNETYPALIPSERLSRRQGVTKTALAVAFIVIGILVYVVFSPYRPLLPKTADYIGRVALTALLALAYFLLSRQSALGQVSVLAGGLLVMSVAVDLDYLCGVFLLAHLNMDVSTPSGFALQKFNEAVIIAAVVICLTLLMGGSLGSIYLHKGHLRRGLLIGGITFCLAAAAAVPISRFMFKAENVTLARILAWLPWLLLCIFANAFEEELILRGLFLRKLQPFFGKALSNLFIVLIFTLLHKGVTYTSSEWLFLVVLLPLAWVWGYIMQKTDALWASVLFHAGMDIPIFLGIFAGMS